MASSRSLVNLKHPRNAPRFRAFDSVEPLAIVVTRLGGSWTLRPLTPDRRRTPAEMTGVSTRSHSGRPEAFRSSWAKLLAQTYGENVQSWVWFLGFRLPAELGQFVDEQRILMTERTPLATEQAHRDCRLGPRALRRGGPSSRKAAQTPSKRRLLRYHREAAVNHECGRMSRAELDNCDLRMPRMAVV